MKEIVRVTIKSHSGYGCIVHSFEYRLTMTRSMMAHEYRPYIATEENPVRKWRYTTTSATYAAAFEKVSGLIEETLYSDLDGHVLDAGGIEFILTYSDKTRFQKYYTLTEYDFPEIFRPIARLIPQAEWDDVLLSMYCEEESDD